MEDGNETVSRKSAAELPLNPVVTCGRVVSQFGEESMKVLVIA